jgi:hypothetical protein
MRKRLPTAGSPALAELWERDLARGVDPTGEAAAPPPKPGPPVHTEPLLPLVIPPADFRAEIEEQARREAAAAAQDELEPEQPSYPATKQPKPRTSTPRLDEVRSWGPP